MKHYLFLLLLLTSVCISCYAQQSKLDSLIAVANANPKDDSLKVRQLQNICRYYSAAKLPDDVDRISIKAFAIAKKINNAELMISVYEKWGLTYHHYAMYGRALDLYQKAQDIAAAANNKYRVGSLYINIGELYSNIPDYAKALEASQRGVNIFNDLKNNDGLSSCYMNIGDVYAQMGQHDQAIAYMKKALAIFIKLYGELDYGTALAYSELANNYLEASDSELKIAGIDPAAKRSLALDHLNRSLYATQHGASAAGHEGPAYLSLAKFYDSGGEYTTALTYFQRALTISRKTETKDDLIKTLLDFGDFCKHQNEWAKSKLLLKEALQLSEETGRLENEETASEMLSELYEKEGKADSALFFFKKHMVINEQLVTAAKEKDIARRQMKLDFSIKENDYKLAQAATDYKLKQHVLLAEQKQQELLLQYQQLQLIKKQKDLERLAYLQQQEKLQNEKHLAVVENEKNMVQAKLENAENDKKINSRDRLIAEDEKTKLYLITGLGLLLGLAGVVFYNQRRTAKLNKTISVQKTSLEQLSEVKDKIFSVVSHDMRTPVNSLISFIDILESGALKQEKLAMYAAELKTNLTHTSSLMNNLLLWASSQMKGFRTITETLKLQEIIATMIAGIEHHQQLKNISIINEVPERLTVQADKNMLAVLLRNITGNAIKFSYPHGKITIAAQPVADKVAIHIKDEGTGMSVQMVRQFNSEDAVITESKRGTGNEKGTGLGLLLCKTFAAQMGGNVVAQNDEQGMTFIITLPA